MARYIYRKVSFYLLILRGILLSYFSFHLINILYKKQLSCNYLAVVIIIITHGQQFVVLNSSFEELLEDIKVGVLERRKTSNFVLYSHESTGQLH